MYDVRLKERLMADLNIEEQNKQRGAQLNTSPKVCLASTYRTLTVVRLLACSGNLAQCYWPRHLIIVCRSNRKLFEIPYIPHGPWEL